MAALIQRAKANRASLPSRSSEKFRPPRIVIIAAPKGGVGKTTLSMSLLVSAKRAGHAVLGVNVDEQLGLERWFNRRNQLINEHPDLGIPEIPICKMSLGEWRTVQKLTDYDVVIVDTPPGHGESLHAIRSLCTVSDLVLIPTSSSGHDLDEVAPFGGSVAPDKSVFVLNRVNRRTRSFATAQKVLIRYGSLCPIELPLLESVSTQFMRGLAITDFQEAGYDSFDGLWHFVRRQIGLMDASISHGPNARSVESDLNG